MPLSGSDVQFGSCEPPERVLGGGLTQTGLRTVFSDKDSGKVGRPSDPFSLGLSALTVKNVDPPNFSTQ